MTQGSQHLHELATVNVTTWAFQVVLVVKNPLASAGDRRPGFDPCVRKVLWRRAWQPTPGLLPGKSYGQRSLAGYHTHDCKESDKPIGSDSKESVCNARDWVQPLGRRI